MQTAYRMRQLTGWGSRPSPPIHDYFAPPPRTLPNAPSNPILMTKFQTISWVNYMRLWKAPPNEYICAPTASKHIYGMYVPTFVPGNFWALTNYLSTLCGWLTSSKLVKISEISECLFVWLSILTGKLWFKHHNLVQVVGYTPRYELCKCQCSTLRVWIFRHDILFASQSWLVNSFYILDTVTRWQAKIQALWQALKGLVKQDNPPHLSPHPSLFQKLI